MEINKTFNQFSDDFGNQAVRILCGGGRIHGETLTQENIFRAWKKFKRGKMHKNDVLEFSENAEVLLHELGEELQENNYRHGRYTEFKIRDPKLRTINKAFVRDRVVHQALFSYLEKIFEPKFIFDSYSSRRCKGALAMLLRFEDFAHSISQGEKRSVWVLKCDIRKFFDSVDHEILLGILRKHIPSRHIIEFLEKIIGSFSVRHGKGIPLGNLTSQIFSNIYLNHCDQFMKRRCGIWHYLRYADDIIVLSPDPWMLCSYLEILQEFLRKELQLEIHPDKISFRTWRQGVDVLGYVSYPGHRTIRTKTKHRIQRKLGEKKALMEQEKIDTEKLSETIASYRGRIKHGWSQELIDFLGL